MNQMIHKLSILLLGLLIASQASGQSSTQNKKALSFHFGGSLQVVNQLGHQDYYRVIKESEFNIENIKLGPSFGLFNVDLAYSFGKNRISLSGSPIKTENFLYSYLTADYYGASKIYGSGRNIDLSYGYTLKPVQRSLASRHQLTLLAGLSYKYCYFFSLTVVSDGYYNEEALRYLKDVHKLGLNSSVNYSFYIWPFMSLETAAGLRVFPKLTMDKQEINTDLGKKYSIETYKLGFSGVNFKLGLAFHL